MSGEDFLRLVDTLGVEVAERHDLDPVDICEAFHGARAAHTQPDEPYAYDRDRVDRQPQYGMLALGAGRDVEEKARRVGGHGGMDFIMDYRLVYCLQHGLPLDQDVYDAAEWSCIGSLTAASLEHNSMPVAVPDFTRGDWDKVDGFRHAMAQ